MKKILVFFMLLLSLTALAEGYLAVTSKDGYANLRKEASTKSKILKKIDDSYTILEVSPNEFKEFARYENWYLVAVEKSSDKDGYYSEMGYIHKSQLGKHPEIYVTSSKDDHINVRAKANSTSQILVTLDSGMHVRRYPEKTVGDWYYVNYGLEGAIAPVTTEGYIHKSQLKKEKQ